MVLYNVNVIHMVLQWSCSFVYAIALNSKYRYSLCYDIIIWRFVAEMQAQCALHTDILGCFAASGNEVMCACDLGGCCE